MRTASRIQQQQALQQAVCSISSEQRSNQPQKQHKQPYSYPRQAPATHYYYCMQLRSSSSSNTLLSILLYTWYSVGQAAADTASSSSTTSAIAICCCKLCIIDYAPVRAHAYVHTTAVYVLKLCFNTFCVPTICSNTAVMLY